MPDRHHGRLVLHGERLRSRPAHLPAGVVVPVAAADARRAAPIAPVACRAAAGAEAGVLAGVDRD